jgi:hypothetical protein
MEGGGVDQEGIAVNTVTDGWMEDGSPQRAAALTLRGAAAKPAQKPL